MNGIEHYKKRETQRQSSLCCFARCPRRYFYRYGCRLRATEEGKQLTFGKAIHIAIPHLFYGNLTGALTAFSSVWGDQIGDDKRNLNRAEAILKDFMSSHAEGKSIYIPVSTKHLNIKPIEGISEFEIPFAVDVGLDIPFKGRIDCLGRHKETGELWIVDYKTTSQLGSLFLSAFSLCPQLLCYGLAAQTLLNEKIAGAFVEGLLVAKVSVGTAVIPVYFNPSFSFADIHKWIKWIYGRIEKCEKEENFEKDFTGCNSLATFGMPSYTCEFEPLCSVIDWTSLIDLFVVEDEKEDEY